MIKTPDLYYQCISNIPYPPTHRSHLISIASKMYILFLTFGVFLDFSCTKSFLLFVTARNKYYLRTLYDLSKNNFFYWKFLHHIIYYTSCKSIHTYIYLIELTRYSYTWSCVGFCVCNTSTICLMN